MNPPNVARIHSKLLHTHQYVRDMAYILPYNESHMRKTFKRRIYKVLNNMDRAKYGIQEPRIVHNNPGIPWRRIWTNLHSPVVPEMVKSAWFVAIHDIVPTNDRLASIHLANTSSCARCGKVDSIQHKITECMEGQLIWNWTRSILRIILRMDTRHIPPELAETTRLPLLAPEKAVCADMDNGTPSILPFTFP